MNTESPQLDLTEYDDAPLTNAEGISRGVSRLLSDLGFATLFEFKLSSRRRADLAGLDRQGLFVIVEVKSSLADFRSDRKWREYIPHCDQFFFAVDSHFPIDALPTDEGLIVADRFHASIRRPAQNRPMNGNRRRGQTLRFARVGARRLASQQDPMPRR